MNWLKLKFRNWINSAEDTPTEIGYATSSKNRLVARSDVDGEEGLNITVRSAVGGKIVSFRHHDHKMDRYTWKTYVIPEELDFERELGKMITLESMRL
jgi:hypothetical protein